MQSKLCFSKTGKLTIHSQQNKGNNNLNNKKELHNKPIYFNKQESIQCINENIKSYSNLDELYSNLKKKKDWVLFLESKIKYLSELINLESKFSNKETKAKIKKYYDSFNYPSSQILISRFIREIPNEKKYYYRLALEFRLIKQKHFTKVFLQVLDILDLCDERIPHVIRGSSGSSLVCYLLGITDIDPILENISLARFMHVQRNDLPDIDMDFPHKERDRLYEKIFDKYNGRVARISNHVFYGGKTATKEIIKKHGHKGFIPKDFNLEDYFSDEEEIFDILTESVELEGEFKNFSLHCGGIVIFDDKVPDKYILQDFQINKTDYKKGDPIAKLGTQISLNKNQVDDLSFIKIDILSNRGLSELWDISRLPIEEYPRRDSKTEKLLESGDNLGLVYAESRAISKAFKVIKPQGIQDIALALAIIRPAASGNGQKQAYLRDLTNLINNGKSQNSINENSTLSLKNNVTGRKYIIYDDDAIQVIQELLKCDESNADKFRKAFAKNKYELKLQFKSLLKRKQPMLSNDERDEIYEQLCCLQDYSFCKSHAISYAKLVWALAYQKVHKPKLFWLSALNNCNSSFRTWVHFRNAVDANISLEKAIETGGKKPWRLDIKENVTYLVSMANIKIEKGSRTKKRNNIKLDSWIIKKNLTKTNNNNKSDTNTKLKDNKTKQIKELLQYGFWTSKEFLSDCYLEILRGKNNEVLMSYNKYYKEKNEICNTLLDKKVKVEYNVNKCKFRGLIACYRICKSDKNSKKYAKSKASSFDDNGNNSNITERKCAFITFVTIGIDNNKLIDCVLWGKINLKKIQIIEGEGLWMNNKPENSITPWIKVSKWNPSFN